MIARSAIQRNPARCFGPLWRNNVNKKVLKTLEYNKIIDRLAEHATSDPGRRLCRELVPMTELSDIENASRKPRTP